MTKPKGPAQPKRPPTRKAAKLYPHEWRPQGPTAWNPLSFMVCKHCGVYVPGTVTPLPTGGECPVLLRKALDDAQNPRGAKRERR
jgi:hypothetical protein